MNTNQLNFRQYSPNDYETIVCLWKSAGLKLSPSDTTQGLQLRIKRDPELFFFLEKAGVIVGSVMGSYDGRRGWITHLVVTPSQQGHGFGKCLMKELEKRLRSIGCEKVNLLIESDNVGVESFYQRLDYRRDELVFMEKWLTDKPGT